MHRRLAALLFVLSFACPLFAQGGSATLTGFIQDSSKAFIPGVKVVAIETGTNQRFEGTTGKDGSYNITGLPVGAYRMEIEKPAFKTIVREGMFLHVQDTLQINFQMAVGSTSSGPNSSSAVLRRITAEVRQGKDSLEANRFHFFSHRDAIPREDGQWTWSD